MYESVREIKEYRRSMVESIRLFETAGEIQGPSIYKKIFDL